MAALTFTGVGSDGCLTQAVNITWGTYTKADITLWTVGGAGTSRTKNYSVWANTDSGLAQIGGPFVVPADNKVTINSTDYSGYSTIFVQPLRDTYGFFGATSPVGGSDKQAKFNQLVTSWGNPPSTTNKTTENSNITMDVVLSGGGGMS